MRSSTLNGADQFALRIERQELALSQVIRAGLRSSQEGPWKAPAVILKRSSQVPGRCPGRRTSWRYFPDIVPTHRMEEGVVSTAPVF